MNMITFFQGISFPENFIFVFYCEKLHPEVAKLILIEEIVNNPKIIIFF